VKLNVANDSTIFTLEAADSVIHDLLIAVFLVAFVMLFSCKFQKLLIVMVSIPASLISTFIGFYYWDIILNLMSLLGLSLVVYSFVDDAIVVLENILQAHGNGKNRVRAAYDGTAEIGGTVTDYLGNCCRILTDCDEYGLVSNIITQFCVTVIIPLYSPYWRPLR
jgi:HAE1 family hydrophobic/amphiphilic exporter-1